MPDTLGFDEQFERHFTNHMLQDSAFLMEVHELILPEHFANEFVQRVVRLCKRFAEDEGAAPGTLIYQALNKLQEEKLLSKEAKEPLEKFINELFTLPLQNRGFLLKEVTRFVKHQGFKRAMLPAIELVKKGEFDKAQGLIVDSLAVTNLKTKDLGRKFNPDPHNRIMRRQVEEHVRFWTLIPEMDREIQGLRPGELGVWQSQRSSAGKTAALIHLARAAVFQGKKVMFYVLEGSEDAIEDRLDQCCAGLTKDGLLDRATIQLKLQKMFRFGGDIWIKKFPMYLTRVSDLREHLRQVEAQYNWHPDVVIIDYADLLAPETGSIRGDLYATGAEVYGFLTGWLQEEELVGWTGLQSNRTGMESDHADQEHTGGSIAKAQIAHLIISINRTAEEHRQGFTRLHVVKNRDGQARFDIKIRTDFQSANFWRYDANP